MASKQEVYNFNIDFGTLSYREYLNKRNIAVKTIYILLTKKMKTISKI